MPPLIIPFGVVVLPPLLVRKEDRAKLFRLLSGGGKLVDTILVKDLYLPFDVCSFCELRKLARGGVPGTEGAPWVVVKAFICVK